MNDLEKKIIYYEQLILSYKEENRILKERINKLVNSIKNFKNAISKEFSN